MSSNLIVLPIALACLPTTQFSLWLLFQSLLAFAQLADSGLSPTLLRATAFFMGGGRGLPLRMCFDTMPPGQAGPNWEGVHSLVITTAQVYRWVVLAAALLMGTFGFAASWNLLRVSGHTANCWAAFGVMLVWACIQVAIARWSGILQGLGEVAAAKQIDGICSLLKLVTVVPTLLAGGDLLALVLVGCGGATVNYFAMRRAVHKRLPARQEPPKAERSLLSSVAPATCRLGLINWGAFLITHGSAVVVAQLSDSHAVASYLLTLRLFTFLRQLSQAPLTAMLPQAVMAISKSDTYTFRRLTVQIVVISLLVYALGAGSILIGGDWLVSHVKPHASLVSVDILLIIAVTQFLELHHIIHAALYVSTNHVPFVWPSLLSGLLILVFGFWLIRPLGLYGIVLSQLTVQAACNNWFPVYLSLRLTRWHFVDYLRSTLGIWNSSTLGASPCAVDL